jgi:hypothetical protein
MKRILFAVSTFATVMILALPAWAETESVLAAEHVSRYDSGGGACGVIVDDYLEMEVNAYCFGGGHTWVKVRVPGVDGNVTRVSVQRRGDCSDLSVTYRKNGDNVTVKIAESGDFDCYYKRVIVRHTG